MNQDEFPILVSIIIPHHNNKDILLDCLKSIYQSSYQNFEIIIVDNASSDDSINHVHVNYPEVIIIKSLKNLGYAGGCNLGAKDATGDYLFFLNNDTVLDHNCISKLVDKLRSDSKISSVQPKILNLDDKSSFDYAGASGGFMDYLVFPFTRGRIFNRVETDQGQYDDSVKIFWASGAGFLTRKSNFDKIEGFDENLFAHMEEIDYHWKSYLSDSEVWVEPSAVLYHLGGATLPMQSAKKVYYNHRNSLVLLLSNYCMWRSLCYFTLRLPLEIISSLKELVSLRPLHFLYHYLALLWIVFNFSIILKRRRKIKSIKTVSNQKLFDQKMIASFSLLIKYYVFNKKTYNKL